MTRFAPFRTIAVLFSASVIAACSRGEPIRIGIAGPFSQERGESMRRAAELAANEINRSGGVAGRAIQLVLRDDSASTAAAAEIARELYDDERIVAVVGHLTSGTTLAAAPIYNGGEHPLVQVSPSASSPKITQAGRYTFRVCPTDLVHGAKLAERARAQLDATRAAIVYQNDDYGRGVRSTFVASFVAQGGTIVANDPYLEELPSLEPYLQRLRSVGGADVLFVAGTMLAAERVIATLDSIDLRLQVLGGDGLSGIERSATDAEGVMVSTAYLPDRAGENNTRFVTAYRAAYEDQVPDHRGAGAYDIIHLLAQAIATVGPNRGAIRDYLAEIGRGRPAFEGVTGAIAFDQNGDVPRKDVVIGVVSAGELRAAPVQ